MNVVNNKKEFLLKIKFTVNHFKIFLLLICIIFIGCDPRYGFMESSFQLADDSRLPKWFVIPKGYSRNDIKVTIDVYTSLCPFCNNTVTILHGPLPDNKVIMKKAGKQRWHPLSDIRYNKYPSNSYPNYTIITIDGIDEVFEQRHAGNILYITDDPNITSYNNK